VKRYKKEVTSLAKKAKKNTSIEQEQHDHETESAFLEDAPKKAKKKKKK